MNLTTGYTNPIFEMIGYEPKTTFWTDFSIADMFGVEGVKDTYNRAKDEWQDNIEYMQNLPWYLIIRVGNITKRTKFFVGYILIYGLKLTTLSMSISKKTRKHLATIKQ